METSHVQQDRYDNDNNDMHEGLLYPINFSPFGNIKKKRRGMSRQFQGRGEEETQNGGKPSSPHADSPNDSKYDQCAARDARIQSAGDPYVPLCAQIATGSDQTEK